MIQVLKEPKVSRVFKVFKEQMPPTLLPKVILVLKEPKVSRVFKVFKELMHLM